MALRGGCTLLLALIWIHFSSSTLRIHQYQSRIIVKRENEAFSSFNTSSGHMIDNLKLVHDRHNANIYAGGPQGLFILNPGIQPALKQVLVPLFEPECKSSSAGCGYQITLLKEGRHGNPLFMCGTRIEVTLCCDVNSEHNPVNVFKLKHSTEINEPCVQVGDSLYYTVSKGDLKGLYRWVNGRFTWPVSTQNEQRYVKILANQGNRTLDGKVYSFYIEQNKDKASDTPLWIPRVSQICMVDRGGSKAVLQYRWTSMLTARLFCGDEKKRLSYTELLDVAVLEAAEWKNTTIYALFKNAYNLRAVCVYRMPDIVRVFTSNELKDRTETFSSPRPGECVENSPTLPSSILQFMEDHPEMKQWIKPARDPLLFNHHHYTHLQVDRVNSSKSGNSHHNVLLMGLESGRIHKILEQDGNGDPFIIAEYEPFQTKTHISSMLLDSTMKKLYVSSGSEVMQIDLHNCNVYGEQCDSCVMARDPYCGWNSTKCSSYPAGSLIQNVTHGNCSVCENVESGTTTKRNASSSVPQYSKFFLKCPMESQHASYVWEHQARRRECVSTEQDCLLLIDSMSEEDEGIYKCVASENGYSRTIVHQALQMNGAVDTRTTPVALACLLLLIYLVC